MNGNMRKMAALAVGLVLTLAKSGLAQDAAAPPYVKYSPAAVQSPSQTVTTTPYASQSGLSTYRLPALNDSSFPPLAGDPLLDEPGFPPPGCYAVVEGTAVDAHFKDRLFGPVPINGQINLIHVPGASLDWTLSPAIELGYRFPCGWGELLLSYRSLVTQGSETLPPSESSALLHSRLNTNQLDIDYANYHALAPQWDMRWRVGAQVQAAYYDSQADTLVAAGGGVFNLDQQRVTNNFVGAGPHAGLELWRHCNAVPGLAFYLGADGSTPWGMLHQSFQETIAIPAGGPATVGGASRNGLTQGLLILDLEAGCSWVPDSCPHFRFTVGYRFESWWSLGRDDNTGSLGTLTENGIFLRGQFNF